MNNADWEKWMAKHHIKLRGEPNDNGSDEVRSGGGISGSKVEAEVPDHARTPGDSHIQKPE